MNEQQMSRVQEHARFLARKSGIMDYDEVQDIEGDCLLAALEAMAKFADEDIGDGLLVQAASWAFFNGRRKANGEPDAESLDEVTGTEDDGNDYTLHDTVPEPDPDPEEIVLAEEMDQMMARMVDSLTAEESDVVHWLYGLDGQLAFTQAEVAQYLSVSQQYVSKVHTRALAKLLGRME
jgi:RNA polymerase sigma factor (sigma-70 family)